MSTLTLTLSIDKELPVDMTKEEMQQALEQVINNRAWPIRKVTIVMEVFEEADARLHREFIKNALAQRPWKVDADIELKDKQGIRRIELVKATPMDKVWTEAEQSAGEWSNE